MCIRNKLKIEEILEQYRGSIESTEICRKLLFKEISKDPKHRSENWLLKSFLNKVYRVKRKYKKPFKHAVET